MFYCAGRRAACLLQVGLSQRKEKKPEAGAAVEEKRFSSRDWEWREGAGTRMGRKAGVRLIEVEKDGMTYHYHYNDD